MALQLSASRPRQLQYSGQGLRRDLRLLELDDALLNEIKKDGCAMAWRACEQAADHICCRQGYGALRGAAPAPSPPPDAVLEQRPRGGPPAGAPGGAAPRPGPAGPAPPPPPGGPPPPPPPPRCSVVIKGGEGDDAVMCTRDKTYALKYVETTNTLLLLPPDEVRPAGSVCGCGCVGSTQGAPQPLTVRIQWDGRRASAAARGAGARACGAVADAGAAAGAS
mgnify:CR=1 FL=1